jgi:signal transduction histidine kinase/AraC-like DNA-binding protein
MPDTIRIGLLADSADPYWVEVRETIWQLASRGRQHLQLSDNWPIRADIELIDIEFIVDVHDYAVKVEEILSLELGALIAVPFAMPLLNHLLDRGLTIISLHERSVEHPRFVKPRTLYQSGCLACEFLAKRMGAGDRVLVVGGRATQEGRSSRLQAAYDVFANLPNIELVHMPAPWDRAGALDAAHAFLTKPDATTAGAFRGVFGLSDTLALVGREVCQQHNLLASNAVVVGINGDPLAIAAVARGEMAATVATSAAHLATESLRLACLAASGAAIPTQFDYCPQLVTAENVAEVALAKLVAIADMPSRLVGVNRRQEERRLIQLQTGLEINQRIGSILDGKTLLREISDLIRANYGYDDVRVFLWDEMTQSLVRHLPTDDIQSERYQLAEAAFLGRALLGRKPVYAPDIQRLPPTPDSGHLPKTRTRIAAPIRIGGQTLGVLDVHSHRVHRHMQADLDALQALADELGIALRNAQLYAEALSARAEAERASHLKTRLLANVSHDLRAPLNVILGYSQAALVEPNPYDIELPNELRTDLQHIFHSGAHLGRLVDDLLILSQAEIGALELVPETVDARALLAEVFEGMAGSCSDCAVTWRLELPETLPFLHADPVRLRQVLLNLLVNAQKHTTSGHITLRAVAQAEALHIWIEDTGRGISPARQQQLNAALSLRNEAELDSRSFGAGLGLRVAHHIVQLLGGALTLKSQPGHGTVCHVELPLAPAKQPAAPADAPIAFAPGPETQERLLHHLLQQTSELTRRIATYIVDHYAAPITREEIANAMQVSDDYVSRVFRKETGMTPWQFLSRYRIVQAQKLLLTNDLTITEVGAQVGFNDPAYFIRVFHRETGKSPQQYRKSAK